MKKTIVLLILVLILVSCSKELTEKGKTYCNPLNLNYRFQYTQGISYREAADPAMIGYKDKYILFVSHSGGYWISDEMLTWKYLQIESLPIEDYAMDAIVINDTVFYIASAGTRKPFYFTTDPLVDDWKAYPDTLPFAV